MLTLPKNDGRLGSTTGGTGCLLLRTRGGWCDDLKVELYFIAAVFWSKDLKVLSCCVAAVFLEGFDSTRDESLIPSLEIE